MTNILLFIFFGGSILYTTKGHGKVIKIKPDMALFPFQVPTTPFIDKKSVWSNNLAGRPVLQLMGADYIIKGKVCSQDRRQLLPFISESCATLFSAIAYNQY